MILESLITDGRKLTLDCCKATIKKDSIVEIPDKFWNEKEVQGAIKLGFVKLVGEEPNVPVAGPAEKEPTKKFISKAKYKLAFECIRGCVSPGGTIEIPESKVLSFEVQNAINSGLLEDQDGEYSANPTHQPVVLEEVVLTDEPTTAIRPPVAPRVPARSIPEARPARPAARPTRNAAPARDRIQARPIGRGGMGRSDIGGSDVSVEVVDGESRLHNPEIDVYDARNPRRTNVPVEAVGSAMEELLSEVKEKAPEPPTKAGEQFKFFDVFKEI